jgi:hypothetical protein
MLRHSLPRRALSIALFAALGLPMAAYAANDRDKNRQNPQGGQDRTTPQHDHQRDLSDAVRRIERKHGWQVLSAEPVEYEGRQVNRIKMVDDRGRVRVIMDDPHKPSPEGNPEGD